LSRADRREYERRVNRVIDHVRVHLAEPLTLADLAAVAAFSPFHFHRIFSAIAGETLFDFVQRVRLERAAAALLHGDASVLAIALDHGFTSAAAFARAFRARFGMTATAWRGGGASRWQRRLSRKIGTRVRRAGKARARRGAQHRRGEVAMSIRVVQHPPYHVAFMRYVGPFGPHGIPELWQRLMRWATAHDVERNDRLGIAYDDPRITAPDKSRYDAAVVVPHDFKADRLVDLMDVPGGAYAVAQFSGTAHDIVEAWQTVFASWLPGSGYQPDDRPCYELYRGDPAAERKTRELRCSLCLPVRPL
jgi:AraC family transcriptional regulator